ncbi:radical SAM protein [Streptomyces silvensis]|uniref:Radical SAM protein n=2 Tax=Streptomyces silvensis TaxID=1765722 RepID=A0A0W7X7M2_9ACTN|nr:radical SAM protein [Streptomyces silvensis]
MHTGRLPGETSMKKIANPNAVIWDITFACPLRCYHCYTESGRRPAKNLTYAEMLRVADAIISLKPTMITLCGGEPLTIKRIVDVARYFDEAGVRVFVYTSGWALPAATVEALADVATKIVVSLDGATAASHDRIRGRAGSFDRATGALARIDAEVARRLADGRRAPRFGIDYVVIRSNFDELDRMCAEVAPRFPHLETLYFGAVVPTGLASRPSFVEHELLRDEQVAELIAPDTVRRLRAVAPASVTVETTENFEVQMNPAFLARTPSFRPMEIEPDGEVRAMPIYEGTVGSLLTEDPLVLWRRSYERWDDPFVVETLNGIRTRADWAEAVRRIDQRYASAEDKARIAARPVYVPLSRGA